VSEHISTIRLYRAIHVSIYARKYVTEDKSETDTIKTRESRKSKQHKIQQNKTSLVQSLLTTLSQKTRWAYSTTLPSPHSEQC